MLNTINFTEAQKNLATLIDMVCDRKDAVVITRPESGQVVLMSLDEYRSIRETAYLLSSPANAKRLMESMEDIREGRIEYHDIIEVDDEEDDGDQG